MNPQFFRKYADIIAEAEQQVDEGWFDNLLSKLNWDSAEADAGYKKQIEAYKQEWAELAPRARAGDPEAQKQIELLRQQIQDYTS